MMKLKMVFGVLLMATSINVFAATALETMKQATDQLLSDFYRHEEVYRKDENAYRKMVEERVAVHFDFLMMSRYVLARHWRLASDEQKIAFARAFKEILVQSYSKALFEFKGREILFLGERAGRRDTDVAIQTQIKDVASGKSLRIEYRAFKTQDNWKVVDVKVEGVSLLLNYRKAYDQKLRLISLDQLIEDMKGL